MDGTAAPAPVRREDHEEAIAAEEWHVTFFDPRSRRERQSPPKRRREEATGQALGYEQDFCTVRPVVGPDGEIPLGAGKADEPVAGTKAIRVRSLQADATPLAAEASLATLAKIGSLSAPPAGQGER